MSTISKTDAIRRARAAVERPVKEPNGGWVVIGPFCASNDLGPCTEMLYASYPQAVIYRARWVAEVALAMLGKHSAESVKAIWYEAPDTVPNLVDVGIAAWDREHGEAR